ncbi:MAG: hypothetical protein ACYCQI_12100 [Gammaproteobacteria bacterium]
MERFLGMLFGMTVCTLAGTLVGALCLLLSIPFGAYGIYQSIRRGHSLADVLYYGITNVMMGFIVGCFLPIGGFCWGGALGIVDGIKGGLRSPLTFYDMVSESFHRDRSNPNTAAINQELLDSINSLPVKAHKFDFLSQDEINQFRIVINMLPKNEKNKWEKKLRSYIEYTETECAISLTPVPKLEQPITIEGRFAKEDRNYAHSYELDSLKDHINVTCRGKKAFEPTNRDLLADKKHIKIYKGFAREICEFVNYVRTTIRVLFGNNQKAVTKVAMQAVSPLPQPKPVATMQASPVFFKPQNRIVPTYTPEHCLLQRKNKPSPAQRM